MTEGVLWIFIFSEVVSLRRGVSFLRGVSFHRRGVRKLFLLSLEKVNAQRVDEGMSAGSSMLRDGGAWRCVLARLRGREGIGREGNNAGLFYFYFLRRK